MGGHSLRLADLSRLWPGSREPGASQNSSPIPASPSCPHKSQAKSCPRLCCHLFSASQPTASVEGNTGPVFWTTSKFSPDCDPLLESPRASQIWSQARFLRRTSPSAVPSRPRAGGQQGRGGHRTLCLRPGTERGWPAGRRTLRPEGPQPTLPHPLSEAKRQGPEQPSHVDGS